MKPKILKNFTPYANCPPQTILKGWKLWCCTHNRIDQVKVQRSLCRAHAWGSYKILLITILNIHIICVLYADNCC